MKIKLAPLNHSHLIEVNTIEQSSHLTPWSEKIIQQSFGPRSHNVGLFCVEKNQWQLIGYYFSEHVAGEVSLENMCVAAEFQGKGYAHRLMTDLIDYGQEITAQEIWLEVRTSNVAAINLYKKYGFSTVSERKNYYSIPGTDSKENALLMSKHL